MSAQGGGFGIAPGTRIGDLLLVRELGRGNQGVVYEAHQVSLGRSVAVKILPREITSVDEQLDRFHREAEAAGRLAHPNIVTVYGFDDAHGHPLIVQELVTGGSLEKVLADKAARREGTSLGSCRWAAETCRQLAEALEHAHRHNVIHRDIKPGNVLLTEAGVPKLTDFGLAKVSDLMDLSHTGTIMGTPHYMSPEQVSGRPGGLDARTDVYALGALLYRMLTHEVPFAADSLQRMFNDILTREPRPPRKLQPGVHPDLEAVCLKALEKSPEARYASAAAMGEDLARFLGGETTFARPVGPAGRALRLMGRQSTVALGVLALLVPTAWFAGDVVLRSDAATDARLHDVRSGLALLAALLLAWPLSHLGMRLSRGRAWGGAAACALALALGLAGVLVARGQKATQLQQAAREQLTVQLDLEPARSRLDTADLDAFAAEWQERLVDEDLMLLARGFLKRERPVQAEAWAARLSARTSGQAVTLALRFAIAAALGRDEEAAAAEAGLREAQAGEVDWRAWERTGDLLFDMRRREEARASYERAARLPNADRDLLNLELANVAASLCAWDEAADLLDDVRKWRPDDPVSRQLAIAVAKHAGDWEAAGHEVAAYVANPLVGPVERLDSRFRLLLDSGHGDEADRLLNDTRAGPEAAAPKTGALVREWCARSALERGLDRQQRAAAAAAGGNGNLAGTHAAAALAWLEAARADYQALADGPGDSLIGRVGLSAVTLRLVPYRPAEADALYEQAVASALRAIELDPWYWQAHYNLGVARWRRALTAAGGREDAMPVAAWREVADALQGSVKVNGLQAPVLNDAAHALGVLSRSASDPGLLPQAADLARRAVARAGAAAEGACRPGPVERLTQSACWDTLSELQELQGDAAGALESSRAAFTALDEVDAQVRAVRAARVAALEEKVAGG